MKNLLFFLIIGLPLSVLAQANYYQGYVIKTNGDTIKGYINYREWSQSPHYIDFKINKDDRSTQQFNPLTTKGFQINGFETYISYIGDISINRTKLSDLPNDLDTSKKTDTTFLRQLVTGNHLKLYYHSDNIKNRFFIAEIGGQPTELKEYEYLNDVNQVVNTSVYKGQLLLYINKFRPGNDRLITKVEQTPYTADDLERIVDAINENKSAAKKTSIVRLYAGVSVNNTATNVVRAFYFNTSQTANYMSPKINAGIDIFSNPNVQQFIFRVELYFSYIKPQIKYGGINGDGSAGIYTFNQYTGTIAPQLLFNIYNKDKIKVYIDAGVGLNFSSYSNDEFHDQWTVQRNPYRLESQWVNFPLQAGIVLNKRYEFCFTYTGYAAYTNYELLSVANQSTSLGVKYLFGK